LQINLNDFEKGDDMETFSVSLLALLIGGALLAISLYLLFKSFASSSETRWIARVFISVPLGIFLFGPSCIDSSVKSRQSEAKQSLGTIAKNQEAYFAEFGTYADSSEKLGFIAKSEGSRRYYTYSYSGVSATGYTAIATSLAPGISGNGEGDDVWTINEKLGLQNIKNAAAKKAELLSSKIISFFAVFIAFFVLYDFLIYKLRRETSRHHDYDLCKKRSAKNVSENIEKCPACGSSDIHWVYIRNGKFGYKCSHCKEISSENEKGDMSG